MVCKFYLSFGGARGLNVGHRPGGHFAAPLPIARNIAIDPVSPVMGGDVPED